MSSDVGPDTATRSRIRSPWVLFGVVAVVFVSLWFAYWDVVQHRIPVYNLSDNKAWEDAFARRGQFGDMFGGVTALFSALTLAGLVITIHLQQRESADLQREREKTLRAMEDQTTQVQNQAKHLRDGTEQQVLGDVLRDYRSPNMLVAVKCLWDLQRATSKQGTDIAEEYARLTEDASVFGALQPDLHANRRLVSHFYQRLAGLWKLGVLTDRVVFMFFTADDLSIVTKAIEPIEKALSIKHWGKVAFADSFEAMLELVKAAARREALKEDKC